MTAKELIDALKQCEPNTSVLVESSCTNDVYTVVEYTYHDNSKLIYIGDDVEHIDNFHEENGDKVTKRTII